MPLSKRVATLYEVDGREFVDVDDFLNCYPDADEKAKAQVKRHLETFNGGVESHFFISPLLQPRPIALFTLSKKTIGFGFGSLITSPIFGRQITKREVPRLIGISASFFYSSMCRTWKVLKMSLSARVGR